MARLQILVFSMFLAVAVGCDSKPSGKQSAVKKREEPTVPVEDGLSALESNLRAVANREDPCSRVGPLKGLATTARQKSGASADRIVARIEKEILAAEEGCKQQAHGMVVELEERINDIINGRNVDFTNAENKIAQWRVQNKKVFKGASFENEILEKVEALLPKAE